MANISVPRFASGDRVLCFHGPLIYEAKCLEQRVNKETNVHEYLIHYQRWSKKWDEWVSESRILPYNDENLQRQAELKESHGNRHAKRNKSTPRGPKGKEGSSGGVTQKGEIKSEDDLESRSSTPSVEGKNNRIQGKKRPASDSIEALCEDDIKTEEDVDIRADSENNMETESPPTTPVPPDDPPVIIKPSDIDFKTLTMNKSPLNLDLIIPPSLKWWVDEDWAQLTQSNPRFLILPSEVTVSIILSRYYAFMCTQLPSEHHVGIKEDIEKIETLFNRCLGMYLLFKWERTQYSDLLLAHPGVKASHLYGAHHFLRFFEKLSDVLAKIPKNSNMKDVLPRFEQVLRYLAANEKEFFKMSNYTIPSAEYQRRALM